MMVVFSTNLDPNDLADEAFLRRIQTKVLVEAVTPEIFDQIFQRVMQTHQVPSETTAARVPARVLYGRRACNACAPVIPWTSTSW